MGGWNRSRHVRRHYDRSQRPSRPPLPPPDYGQEHCSVPLWEREFCSYVGDISWQRFCENKHYVSIYSGLEQWDDSGAFENFQNAKARFCANYHGQPSDIPLPDPDMYIDKVDHHCKIDPELVADLDKIRLPFDSDNSSVQGVGSANAGADNKCTQNGSGNWDIYIEKPAEVNKWDWEANPSPNAVWGAKHDSSGEWGNSNSGWDSALDNSNWRSSNNNRHSSWRNRNNSSYGGSYNRYQEDPSQASGRKRNRGGGGGGYFQQRNNKQRSQNEGSQRSSWQDHGGRNNEWRPWNGRPCQNGQGIEGGR